MPTPIKNDTEWDEWKDLLGNTIRPGDLLATANGGTSGLKIGTLIALRRVDSKGEVYKVSVGYKEVPYVARDGSTQTRREAVWGPGCKPQVRYIHGAGWDQGKRDPVTGDFLGRVATITDIGNVVKINQDVDLPLQFIDPNSDAGVTLALFFQQEAMSPGLGLCDREIRDQAYWHSEKDQIQARKRLIAGGWIKNSQRLRPNNGTRYANSYTSYFVYVLTDAAVAA